MLLNVLAIIRHDIYATHHHQYAYTSHTSWSYGNELLILYSWPVIYKRSEYLTRVHSPHWFVLFIVMDYIHAFLFQASAILIPPTVGRLILASPLTDKYDLSSVKRVLTGAAPIKLNLISQLSEKLNGAKVDVGKKWIIQKALTINPWIFHQRFCWK